MTGESALDYEQQHEQGVSTTHHQLQIVETERAPLCPSTMRKSVCWGTLTFYIFPVVLGDHPSVSEGAPLSLAWKHTTKNELAIDYYEYLRESHRPRRKRKELFIPGAARDTFLLSLGYTLQQLMDSTEEIRKIRKSRQANMKGPWEKLFKQMFDRKKAAARRQNIQQARKPVILAAKCG